MIRPSYMRAALTTLWLFTCCASAQVGETFEQVAKRFGVPAAKRDGNAAGVVYCGYNADGMPINAAFMDGICVSICYRKISLSHAEQILRGPGTRPTHSFAARNMVVWSRGEVHATWDDTTLLVFNSAKLAELSQRENKAEAEKVKGF
jgi:hypothetical protein